MKVDGWVATSATTCWLQLVPSLVETAWYQRLVKLLASLRRSFQPTQIQPLGDTSIQGKYWSLPVASLLIFAAALQVVPPLVERRNRMSLCLPLAPAQV